MLYATCNSHPSPTPVLPSTRVHVIKTISSVPSRSISAKVTVCTPAGSLPSWASWSAGDEDVGDGTLRYIWKNLLEVPCSSQTRKRSARQSPLRSTTALLCGFDIWHGLSSKSASPLFPEEFISLNFNNLVDAHIEKTLESGSDPLNTFLHTLSDVDPGVTPSKSIFKSPFTSNGIGWPAPDDGTVIGVDSVKCNIKKTDLLCTWLTKHTKSVMWGANIQI